MGADAIVSFRSSQAGYTPPVTGRLSQNWSGDYVLTSQYQDPITFAPMAAESIRIFSPMPTTVPWRLLAGALLGLVLATVGALQMHSSLSGNRLAAKV